MADITRKSWKLDAAGNFALISFLLIFAPFSVQADQVILDDLIVNGSACIGQDCVNGESFGFDTIRLKENNLRIRAVDSSSSSSFPTNDWQITFNDSANGGANKFSIDDIDSGRTPFTIEASAPSHSLYVDDGGRVGFGTSTPVVDLHVKSGNTPTLRLEQDGSSGFAAQTWDVAGNETNFFIRDATNGSKLPFRIVSNAPNASIFVAADGDVGLQTTTPDGLFDVAHSSDANNHAFFVGTDSYVGVNIDNGHVPAGLFDVQTTGGVSQFTVASDGNVGLGTASPSAKLHVVDNESTAEISSLVIENTHANEHAVLLELSNAGNTYIKMANSTGGADVTQWFIGSRDNGDMTFSNNFTAGRLLKLDKYGNLTTVGTVNGASSYKIKENFSSVNMGEILDIIGKLNISKWNYIKEGETIKHIGPMAEQFHQLFGLNGNNDDSISYTDITGVALAAIQALKKESDLLKLQINELREELISKNK